MWANVARPIFDNNSKKYLTELSKEEVVIFESVAGDVLEILGYRLEYPELSGKLLITEDDVLMYDQENSRLKEQANLTADPEGVKLREPQDNLIAGIKGRLMIG